MHIIIKGIALGLLLLTAVHNSRAQLIVRVKPDKPVVVATKPAAPGTTHVWVEEDWKINDKKYEWKGGYYVEPPRSNAEWIPGHWSERNKGWVWIPGHWRY
jgi:hypothetical protein